MARTIDPWTEVEIAGIRDYSLCDGPGVRRVVYFQGCNHKCKGCHNQDTWNSGEGTVIETHTLFDDVPPIITGFTFSGGEPLLQYDALVKALRAAKFFGYDTTLYTGLTLQGWESLVSSHPELLDIIDYVKIGPYIEAQRSTTLAYRGSANQKFYRVDKEKGGKLHEIVPEWCLIHRKVNSGTRTTTAPN